MSKSDRCDPDHSFLFHVSVVRARMQDDPMTQTSPHGQQAGHTSYSALTSYLKCPKAHELQRVLGLDETAAWWSIGGSAFHGASEENDRNRYAASGT